MNKMIRFIILLAISLVSQGYANTLKEIFEIKEISSLYGICKKINKKPIVDDISILFRFSHHNDRDFDDCCQALILCKNLSDKSELNSKDESLCINSIRYVLGYLKKIKSYICSLYKDDLIETDCAFFNEINVDCLIKKINELEQKGKSKAENTVPYCTIL